MTAEDGPEPSIARTLALPGEVNGLGSLGSTFVGEFACVTSAGVVAVVRATELRGLVEIARCQVDDEASLIDIAIVDQPGRSLLVAVGIAPSAFILEWDGATLRQRSVVTIADSADNRAIASLSGSGVVVVGGQGGVLTIIDAVAGEIVKSMRSPHTSLVRSIVASGSIMVSAGQDRSIVVWNTARSREIEVVHVLKDAHGGWIWDLAIDANRNRVFSAASDGRLGELELDQGTIRHVAYIPDHWLMSVATLRGSDQSPDYVIAGDASGVLHCWDDLTLKEIVNIPAHSDEINAIAVSDDQNVVLSGSRDGTITAMSRVTVDGEAKLREFSTRWGSDRPSRRDLLGRERVASFLTSRIVSFLDSPIPLGHRAFLLSGPWGAGKTSLVHMVEHDLTESRPTTVMAEVNAWSTMGRGISWTEAIEAVVSAYVRRAREQSLLRWLRVRISLIVTLSRVAISAVFAVLVLVGAMLLFGSAYLSSVSASAWASVGTFAAGIATLLAVLGSSGQLRRMRRVTSYKASRWETHEARDSVLIAARMIEVCMRTVREPFFLFIDDLDRCVPEAVTELLENVHCVLESRGFEFSESSCVVVAADESWIRSAFERMYPEMTTQDAGFGSRIGSRFLEKLFYLVLPTGRLSRSAEEDYLGSLVLSVEDRVVADHIIFGFRELLPDNPRTMRRIVVAFEGLRELKAAENTAVPQGTLMLWAIIRTRWPDAAIALAANPGALKDPEHASVELREWLRLPEVQRVLTWQLGGPLHPNDIDRCASEV